MMEGTLDHNHMLSKKILAAEKALAMQAPINEAIYGLFPKTPLSIYDCLIPRIASNATLREIMP